MLDIQGTSLLSLVLLMPRSPLVLPGPVMGYPGARNGPQATHFLKDFEPRKTALGRPPPHFGSLPFVRIQKRPPPIWRIRVCGLHEGHEGRRAPGKNCCVTGSVCHVFPYMGSNYFRFWDCGLFFYPAALARKIHLSHLEIRIWTP